MDFLHLDTSIVAAWARRRDADLVARFQNTDPGLFRISFVVDAELRVGILKGPTYAAAQLALRFIEGMNVIQSSPEMVIEYVRIRARLEEFGQRIGDNDLWIAATALADNAVLVTRNIREFSRVDGLKIQEW